MWWEKKLPLFGTVLFRGDWPPRPEDFSFLSAKGISIHPAPQNIPQFWLLELTHPLWGDAELIFNQNAQFPPREIFQHAAIPLSDRDAAISCKTHLGLRFETTHGHVLRDRKQMLRFLRAIMADDGVLAIDYHAQKLWTRESLDEELSHDADLDVEGLFSMQRVAGNDGKVYWMHTHGLAAVGFFDFDILDPSSDVLFNGSDLCRAIAFHILEGRLSSSTQSFELLSPHGTIRMLEMSHFIAHTDHRVKAELRMMSDESHLQNHSVVCEVEKAGLGRLFAAKKPEPSRLLTRGLPDNPVFGFSTAATDLMAERARGTYSLLRSLHEELAEFELPCLVKLGFRVDHGSPTDREHMWFQVHQLQSDSIDCTLTNRPHHVAHLREGDRGQHPVDLITDWVIMTPFGNITPRSSNPARIVRAEADQMRRSMQKPR